MTLVEEGNRESSRSALNTPLVMRTQSLMMNDSLPTAAKFFQPTDSHTAFSIEGNGSGLPLTEPAGRGFAIVSVVLGRLPCFSRGSACPCRWCSFLVRWSAFGIIFPLVYNEQGSDTPTKVGGTTQHRCGLAFARGELRLDISCLEGVFGRTTPVRTSITVWPAKISEYTGTASAV